MNSIPFGVIAALHPRTLGELEGMFSVTENAHSYHIYIDQLWQCGPETLGQLGEMLNLEKPTIICIRGIEADHACDEDMIWDSLPESLLSLLKDVSCPVYASFSYRYVDFLVRGDFEMEVPWCKIGCWIDFPYNTPTDIVQNIRRLMKTPAQAFLKITARAGCAKDVVSMEQLVTRHYTRLTREEKIVRPLIAFSTGQYATETQRKSLFNGSAGAYAHVPHFRRTAESLHSTDKLLEDPFVLKALAGSIP